MVFTLADHPRQTIKCVVWDLDNTLWDGILLEDSQVSLRPEVLSILKILDQRGIINSIASKNDDIIAMRKLVELGIQDYFLYPQINWNAKSTSLKEIATLLNLGSDTLAFIDDQEFERAEVASLMPQVLCLDARHLDTLLTLPEMNPRFITEDARKRREMYRSDITRKQAESAFVGSNEEFLTTLQMELTIAPARPEDLRRVEELTLRTHQLNTTGYAYTYEELQAFVRSKNYQLLIVGLDDKYGSYGKVGLALIECQEEVWIIKLLLMSCRVMSRGIGAMLITHIMRLAKDAHVRLQAEFIPHERNRVMLITYTFAGFKKRGQRGDVLLLENDLTTIQALPAYVKLL